ncbi:MAG TPA: 4Fe-4S dicluster domain-containing protein [Candidatus Omnitrophota bacterium]|nr:4Fe-4S dicluster domain-containing protein [Candidatus Omnitrophota bacterium]HPD84224.1 4Fe-4S dicluster domain-containing protein [Candidatus Omnitrophota bacterium]HRZ03080.1 4Fe-4S dicluster domain-containing protein [Candidatus Omnitrophota bacterium]
MKTPGKILMQVLESVGKKPATLNYPQEKPPMAKGFRGKLKFKPEACVGCMLCTKDCPSGAIQIKKLGEKQFQCEIDLSKCIYCAQCVESCARKALEYTDEFELANIDRGKLKIVYSAQPPANTQPPTNVQPSTNAQPQDPTQK